MKILAGQHKGRNLASPSGSETRPITASIKKSLFDTLAPWLEDALVIDLYAGTGTIGLEAISRGARHVYFAERGRGAIVRLKKNIETLKASDKCTIWRGDITTRLPGWLARVNGQVDLAFVDPPFAHVRSWDWAVVARAIFNPLAGVLAQDGLVSLRLPSKVKLPETFGELTLKRTKTYGDMQILFLGIEPVDEIEAIEKTDG